MRILLVGINYAPDLIGVAKYNAELCEGLTSLGHEVRVITAPPYYPEWKIPSAYLGWGYRSEIINNILVTRAPIYVPARPSGAKRLVHHASFALTSLWPSLATAFLWRPEVVFSVAPSLMSAAFAAWIARRIGAISWLHLQDFEVDAAFDLGLLGNRWLRAPMVAVERRILRSFDCVSSISPQMLDRLASKGVDREKIYEVRNWTDTSQIAPGNGASAFRRQLNLDASHFVALYSGTMSNKQGLDLIVEAARELDQTGSSIRFVMCGEGPHKAMLQSLAADLSNVQFLGLQPSETFAELLKTADTHLIPQRAEAADLVLPSKLGGIFATGRPVIVMARPDTGLATEVTGAGLVIPPGDASALASELLKLANNPELCHKLGQRARSIALTRWDKDAIVGGLAQTLMAVCERDKAVDRFSPTPIGGLRPTERTK
jgi:colanic acid biosynthesis glycosyl transferase WcaI